MEDSGFKMQQASPISQSEAERVTSYCAEFTKLVKQAKKLTPAVKGGEAKD